MGALEVSALVDELAEASTGVALDVGANAGYWTLPLAKMGFEVYAFEPDPLSRTKLEENIAANPTLKSRISVQESALSDKPGEMDFFVRRSIDGDSNINLGLSSLVQRDLLSQTLRVRAETVDTFTKQRDLGKVTFIKVDVEGAESLVLSGAMSTIDEDRPIIVWESLTRTEGNRQNTAKVFRMLSKIGYQHRHLTSTNEFWQNLESVEELLSIGHDLNVISRYREE